MMGPGKLSSIRREVRKAFAMSDAGLLAWFNRQLADSEKKPKRNPTELESLRLLRDALVKETKSVRRRPKRAKVAGRLKS